MIDSAQIQKYYEKYGKEKVDRAMELLSYHNTITLPKVSEKEKINQPIIYVFRHGQSEDNMDFLFSGWRDSKLTQKGRDQALQLAEKLKDKNINMLISSPQIRAVETMNIAVSLNSKAKNLQIHIDERLKERSYGDYQGKSKLEIQFENPDLLKTIRRSYTYTSPNGESLETVVKRVTEFCDEIVPLIKEHKLNVAISCNGNSMRGLRKYFEHLTDEQTSEIESPLAQDYASYSLR